MGAQIEKSNIFVHFYVEKFTEHLNESVSACIVCGMKVYCNFILQPGQNKTFHIVNNETTVMQVQHQKLKETRGETKVCMWYDEFQKELSNSYMTVVM